MMTFILRGCLITHTDFYPSTQATYQHTATVTFGNMKGDLQQHRKHPSPHPNRPQNTTKNTHNTQNTNRTATTHISQKSNRSNIESACFRENPTPILQHCSTPCITNAYSDPPHNTLHQKTTKSNPQPLQNNIDLPNNIVQHRVTPYNTK